MWLDTQKIVQPGKAFKEVSVLQRNSDEPTYIPDLINYSGRPGSGLCISRTNRCTVAINQSTVIYTARGPEPFLAESSAAVKT